MSRGTAKKVNKKPKVVESDDWRTDYLQEQEELIDELLDRSRDAYGQE